MKKPVMYKLGGNCFTDDKVIAESFKADKYFKLTCVFIRTYSTEEEVQQFLLHHEFDSYAYILHDKDLNEDGSPKEPHFHVLAYKKNKFRLTYAIRCFTQNTMIQQSRNKLASFEYLTHKNDPDKTQYPPSAVVSFASEGFNPLNVDRKEYEREQINKFLDDLCNKPLRELALEYGRDLMRNYHRYAQFADNVRYEEARQAYDEAMQKAPDTRTLPSVCTGELVVVHRKDYLATSIARHIQIHGCPPTAPQLNMLYRDYLTAWIEFETEEELDKVLGGGL